MEECASILVKLSQSSSFDKPIKPAFKLTISLRTRKHLNGKHSGNTSLYQAQMKARSSDQKQLALILLSRKHHIAS